MEDRLSNTTQELDPTALAVRHIMELSDAEFDAVIESLEHEPLVSEEEFDAAVSAVAPSLDADARAAIVGFSLAFANAGYRVVEPERFYRSVAERTAAKLQIDSGAVVARVTKLLNTEFLMMAAIAQASLRDNVATLQRATFTTDLRPALLESQATPRLYSIVHRMRIDYSENTTSDVERAIEVVLDHEDLELLIKRATSALDQQRKLQASVGSDGAKVWTPLEVGSEGDDQQ